MGWVLDAHHATIGKRVAIKIMRAGPFRDRASRGRFIAEAQTAALVHHQNVVQVFDLGFLADGRPYFVMEMLEGITLAQLLRRGLRFDEICELAMQIADGLGAIHGVGMVHRDLTPANIMVVPGSGPLGRCKLFDFGIARPVAPRRRRLTPAGDVMGTPTFMAPEQCLDQPIDTRADIYAFGVVLYNMATGTIPFGRHDADRGRIMLSHVRDPVERIEQLTSGEACPPAFAMLVGRCLAKRPLDRYQRIETVRDQLFNMRLLARLTKPPSGVASAGAFGYQSEMVIQTGGSNRLGNRASSLHCYEEVPPSG